MTRISRILVPTDFSPTSDIALTYAIDLATRLRCAVHLLHVIDDSNFATAYADGVFIESASLRTRMIEEAADQMDRCVARCTQAGLVTTYDVITGRPATAIARTAADRPTDLVVMGTHGRGAIAHFMLGSVAEQVVRTAPCAVLTVRDTSALAGLLAQEDERCEVSTKN